MKMNDLHDHFDTLQDPNPDIGSKCMRRVKAVDAQGMEPPKAQLPERLTRTWMVDTIALQTNPHWITTGRVVSSGTLWGQDEPSMVSKKRKKSKKETVEALKKLKVEAMENVLAEVGLAVEKAVEKPQGVIEQVVAGWSVPQVFGMEEEGSDDEDEQEDDK